METKCWGQPKPNLWLIQIRQLFLSCSSAIERVRDCSLADSEREPMEGTSSAVTPGEHLMTGGRPQSLSNYPAELSSAAAPATLPPAA